MEYLDYYDLEGNLLGSKTRDEVHTSALWHKTVHCWIFDKEGNIYFQIRKDEGTLYTTASGHVLSGETVEYAFGREIKEEIGLDIDYNKAILVDIVPFKMDKVKKDGQIFKDRAFANVFVYCFNGNIDEFDFDENEINGLAKINAKEALELFKKEAGSIKGSIIKNINNKNVETKEDIPFESFLVNKGETALKKYGQVLNKVIELNS